MTTSKPVARSAPRPAPVSNLTTELRETHSSVVILTGDYAYKIKKPVDLGFLNFTDPEARRHACQREVELNRRLAPDIYLDTISIRGASGTVYDEGLVMRRMPEDRRLSTLIRGGADVAGELRCLAKLLATFHASAQRNTEISAEAGAMGLRRRWIDNFTETEPFRGHPLSESVDDDVRRLALQYLDGRDVLFTERASAGLYVDGHGDLSSEDIFCLPDHPRVLDCIEFNDQLRWVDVLDDVAFLAMDLEYIGRPDLGTAFVDWYAEFSGTPTVASLLHHYIAYRAFVRAKVAAIRTQQGVTLAAAGADRHLRVALHHLQIGQVTLALVGGAPGTGKTTLARSLADELGWVLLSTDRLRAPATDPYSPAAKAATYQELLTHARQALERGESVVADATWADPEMRVLAEEVASATASRLIALECQSPIEVAAVRAESRLRAGHDSSQAGAVIARELATDWKPWLGAVAIYTDTNPSDAVHQALTAINYSTPSLGAEAQRARQDR